MIALKKLINNVKNSYSIIDKKIFMKLLSSIKSTKLKFNKLLIPI